MADDTPYGSTDTGLPRSLGQFWHDQIDQAEKDLRTKFFERGSKIVRRYRDERDSIDNRKRRFNILWSNVQVQKPALYGRPAKPDVQRRHNDEDPVGRTASMILERAISYEVENFSDFNAAMNGAVEDRLLPGRGVSWVRYEPQITAVPGEGGVEAGGQEAAAGETQITEDEDNPPNERVTEARCPTDYVYWQDFLHNPARTWEEVWWVGRWVYMTKQEGIDRFGEVFEAVPIAYDSTENQTTKKAKQDYSDKKAKVAEIWNKRTGKVCWVAKGYPKHLDEKPDPLQLEGFFPCPRPLTATMTTDSIIPVPDYAEYQDQAEELDALTQRISLLTRACKAVGVFNAEHKALVRLFNESVDNTMIPVDSWAAFAEKGGLRGEVVFMDLTTIIAALQQLYASREQVKQTIYEVMGISDIIRGSTDPNETLGAQQLKANFGSTRLKSDQQEVARYASDLFKMKAQIMSRFYPPEILVSMSGIDQTQDGQNPELLTAALELIKNSTSRDWRIAVESDSLSQVDEQEDKQSRIDCVRAVGTFLKDALPAAQSAPGMIPLISEMVKFLMRGFKVGKTLESAIESSMQAAQQQAQQGMPPEIQQQLEQAQQQLQAEQQRLAGEKAQIDKGKMDLTMKAADLDIREMKFGAEKEIDKAQREAAHEVGSVKLEAVAERAKMAQDRLKEDTDKKVAVEVKSEAEEQASAQAAEAAQAAQLAQVQAMQQMAESFEKLARVMAAPRRLVRDPATGKAAGAEAIL